MTFPPASAETSVSPTKSVSPLPGADVTGSTIGKRIDGGRNGALRRHGRRPLRQPLEIGVDHHLDELPERGTGLPAELLARLRRVPDQMVDLRRAHEPRVLDDRLLPVEADAA